MDGGVMPDILRNVLSLSPFPPRSVLKTAFELMLQTVDVVKYVTPEGNDRLAWQEFQNKLQAFYLFEHVDSVLAFPPGTKLSLEKLVEKTRSLGPFFSVWATEGVGHYHTYLLATNSTPPHGLLSGDPFYVPVETMIPLHTGMGLALAEALLACGDGAKVLASNFLRLCRNNSREGYWRIAAEGLGLVVRNLYPALIAPLDHHFLHTDEEMLAYFWHGVGRGIYFAPGNSLPFWSAPWRCFESSMAAPHELGRRNAVAGCAWAMTLVNLRQPEIVAAFIERHGTQLAENDAFANGVFSAMAVWLHSAPHDSSAQSFCSYQPDSRQSTLLHLWETQVRCPCRKAFHFRNTNGPCHVSDLFRYQPLAAFAMQI